MKKPCVYCAGPYRLPDPVSNTRAAIAVGQQLRDALDIVVCVPHLSLLEDMVCPRPPEYWLAITMDQMRCCDAVYRIEGYSTGSDAEEAEARRLGLPVFYGMQELKSWVKEWKGQHAN